MQSASRPAWRGPASRISLTGAHQHALSVISMISSSACTSVAATTFIALALLDGDHALGATAVARYSTMLVRLP